MKTKKIQLDKKFEGIDEVLKKDIIEYFGSYENAPARVRFERITYYHKTFKTPIKELCQALEVSRSAYYEYLKHKDDRLKRDLKIINAIKLIQEQNGFDFGIDRVRTALMNDYDSLLNNGIISRKKVYRLMKENNLGCKTSRNNYLNNK